MKEEINRLVELRTTGPRIGEAVPPPAFRAKTGLEREKQPNFAGEVVTVESTDGLFTFTVRVVR